MVAAASLLALLACRAAAAPRVEAPRVEAPRVEAIRLPHPSQIPRRDRDQDVGVPLQIPVPPPPELDRRPEAEEPAPRRGPFVIDMGGGEEDEATEPGPSLQSVQAAIRAGDAEHLERLFDGDKRAAVKALAEAARGVELSPARVEPLLRLAEPLAVERIRDKDGRFPPPGQPQQLFNTSVHDALAARPGLAEPSASAVAASLRRLAQRAINDPPELERKLLAAFEKKRHPR